MRVAISSTTAGPFACGDPLVECFDSASPNGSVLHIRGWSSAGTVTPADNPIARDVRLIPGATCTGAYFSSATAQCFTGIEREDRLRDRRPRGGSGREGQREPRRQPELHAHVRPRHDALALRSSRSRSRPEPAPWRSTSTGRSGRARPAGSPARTATTPPARGTGSAAQRIFAGSAARSGPIQNLRVFEITDPALDANSFEACATCAHDLVVELQLVPSLKAASDISDPPVILRLTGSGSLTQALDCDPDQEQARGRDRDRLHPELHGERGDGVPGAQRAVEHRAAVAVRQARHGGAAEQDRGRPEPEDPRRREGEDLHRPPTTGRTTRTSHPRTRGSSRCSSRSSDRSPGAATAPSP